MDITTEASEIDEKPLNSENDSAGYDELPLWSAPFGLTLLDTVPVSHPMKVLDIGSGSGFPMLELAERLGISSFVYGLDPDPASILMVRKKILAKKIRNAEIIQAYAENIPFPDNFFQLIISNNGLNNVADQKKVLTECYRVSVPGAHMVLTMNLPGTMAEFYQIFSEVLNSMNRFKEMEAINKHIAEKRKPVSYLENLIHSSGFQVIHTKTEEFKLRFFNGSAFLQHYFIRKAFMGPWKSILQKTDIPLVFNLIEEQLNAVSGQKHELSLTIPYICFDCQKK